MSNSPATIGPVDGATDGDQARRAIVDRYLAAIGVRRQPVTVDLLDDLTRAHVATLPFSSVGVRLGDDLPLDVPAVADRLVTRRRGGYCFEHNLLMFTALADLGFDPRMVMARVLLSGNPHPPLTHRVSAVTVGDADYLVDVGFGPQGPTAAVPFDGTPVGAPWRPVRIVDLGSGRFRTEAGRDEPRQWLYRFEIAQYGDADCEVGHFYSRCHPQSQFVKTLIASLLLPDEVRSLRNRDYWVLRADGDERMRIDDAGRLHEVLVDDFGLGVSEEESVRLFAAVRDS